MTRATIAALALVFLSGGQAPPPVQPSAARTFNITARRFAYTVSPSPFVVNAGDVVTLNISVPSGEVQHGFFLDHYATTSLTMNPGTSRTINFTANTPGTFFYACTVVCGTGHTDMNGDFIVNAVALPPTITSFGPASGPTAGGAVVLIEGTNFQNGATVKFGDVAAVSAIVNGTTSISAMTPAHDAGEVSVSVTDPDGQIAVAATPYVYEVPGPAIASISPSTGPTSGGTAIAIDGTNFAADLRLSIGGLPAIVIAVNALRIFATTPTGPVDIAGTAQRDVTVTNPDGKSATRTGGFAWTVPPPAISSIFPSIVSPTGGTFVTITGAGFTRALPVTVTFGGVASPDVQILDAVTLTALTPAHAEGTAEVVVQVGSASARSSAFAYQKPGKRRRSVRR